MKLVKPRRRYGCEINITPLIDIVFLLIIFSMVVSQFTRLQAENVALPQARKGRDPTTAPTARIVVNVLNDGRVLVLGRRQSDASLDALLGAEVRRVGPGGVSVVIRGDKRTQWARIARILKTCADQRIGDVKVAVLSAGTK